MVFLYLQTLGKLELLLGDFDYDFPSSSQNLALLINKTSTMKNILFTLIILLFVSPFSHAQKPHLFKGSVYTYQEKAKDATVKVYRGKKCISTYTTKGNGKFLFFPLSEVEYLVEVSKKGYITKRVIVNTKNTRSVEGKIKPYKFDVMLVKDNAVNRSNQVDFPLAIIRYHKEKGQFANCKKYKESLKESKLAMLENK